MKFFIYMILIMLPCLGNAQNIDSLLLEKFDNLSRNSVKKYKKEKGLGGGAFKIKPSKGNYFMVGRDKRDSIVEIQYYQGSRLSTLVEIMEDSLIKISMFRLENERSYLLYSESFLYRSRMNNLYLLVRGTGFEVKPWQIEFISLLDPKLAELMTFDVHSNVLYSFKKDKSNNCFSCKEKISIDYTSYLDVVNKISTHLSENTKVDCELGYKCIGIPDFFK